MAGALLDSLLGGLIMDVAADAVATHEQSFGNKERRNVTGYCWASLYVRGRSSATRDRNAMVSHRLVHGTASFDASIHHAS